MGKMSKEEMLAYVRTYVATMGNEAGLALAPLLESMIDSLGGDVPDVGDLETIAGSEKIPVETADGNGHVTTQQIKEYAQPDLSDYATKAEIPSTEGLLTETKAAETYQPIGDYATKAEIPSTEGLLTETKAAETYQPIGDYATKAEIEGIGGVGKPGEGKDAEIFNDYTNNQATGEGSHAEGLATTASSLCSHAEGSASKASGKISHAEGLRTTASGDTAHTEGCDTIAAGDYSHAEGYNTTANGNYSHTEGYKTKTNGNYSHAEGYLSEAQTYSHAEGQSTHASGNSSHAEGRNTFASGNNSHVEGSYTQTQNDNEHAEGSYNKSNNNYSMDTSGKTRHSVGIGSSSLRKNAFEIMANGDIYVYGLGGYDGTNALDEAAKTLQTVLAELQSAQAELQQAQKYAVRAVWVSVGDSGLATFTPEVALDFTRTAGVAAYTATVTGSTVNLTRTDTVAAGEGVLLRSLDGGAAGVYVPLAEGDVSPTEGNMFVGVLETIEQLPDEQDGYTNFILNSKGVNGSGFYLANNKTVAAGKAYLRVPSDGAPGSVILPQE